MIALAETQGLIVPPMLETLKTRLRAAGWKDFDSEKLRPYFRFYRQIYEPEKQWEALQLPADEFSAAVRAEIFDKEEYRTTEYALELGEPVVVEPLRGMLVARGNQIIKSLLAIHRGVSIPPPYRWQYRKALQKKRRIDRAVLLRHPYIEGNYFHFFNDWIALFLLLKQFPEYADWPLLVSRSLFETAYFQGLRKRAGWQETPWLVQAKDEAIEVERLIVLKGLGLTPEWIRQIWELFRVPEADPAKNRRIFLTRAPGLRRGLSNREEVTKVCVDRGFEPVDAARLTLDEQIQLFSEARFVVAEHGAGSTNVLFRRGQPCTLLELFPPNHVSTCYYLICHHMGHANRWLRGVATGEGDTYSIPGKMLGEALDAAMSEPAVAGTKGPGSTLGL